MNRSIDLLEALAEESGDVFRLNRRGYLYASTDAGRVQGLRQTALAAGRAGAGPLRCHEPAGVASYLAAAPDGYRAAPSGADLLTDPMAIRRHFPYLSHRVAAVLHVRRAGWLSGQQLGMYLLGEARRHGARLLPGRVVAVDTGGDRVRSVRLLGPGGPCDVTTPRLVLATGPFLAETARMVGVSLPVFTELHLKAAFDDHLGAVPRDAPLVICDDAQTLAWDDEERRALAASPDHAWLLDPLPPGAHLRPEGASPESRTVLLLWAYHVRPVPPVFPLPADSGFPELALRGMAAIVPALTAYLQRLPRMVVDGGYYTKTPENRCLVGPLGVGGAYVIGALSGYGLMAACAAGELLAAHVSGDRLPAYAPAFSPSRYEDPAYRARFATAASEGAAGQL